MTIRQPDWYDLNSMRSWPFEGPLKDDTGKDLPYNIIVDLFLRFPDRLGYRAFVPAITVSDYLATLLVSSSSMQPLASLSVVQPVEVGRVYRMEPMAEGVAGWVVWGDGIEEHRGSWRYSRPADSMLQVRSAHAYSDRPVLRVRLAGSEKWLTGIVQLKMGNDIRIYREAREIAGQMRDAIVFALDTESPSAVGRNVLDEYRGPCQGRPESYSCQSVEPLEFINNVGPDCQGRIQIEFRGCAAISTLEGDECGIVVDCGYSIEDACRTKERLPDPCGRLPNQYDDLCSEISSCVDPFPDVP